MKALIAVAAVGVALVASTTAGAGTSGAVGRWEKPSVVEKSGRSYGVVPPSAIGRWGAIGRFGVGRPSAAGFRW